MKTIIHVVLGLTLLTLVSCGGTRADFIISNESEPQSLDPHLIEGVLEHRINLALFEGLMGIDPKTAEAVPGVAESYTVSADGTVYTFKLRDAVWSDGVPITAETVVKSWLRCLNPQTASPYAWFPATFIKGAQDYLDGKAGPESVAIRAIDEKTFEMTLVGPFPYVLGALSHYAFAIVPIHAIEKYGKDWIKPENFVGNGPFVLKEWIPQESIFVVKNPRYWDKDKVFLESIQFLPTEDQNSAYTMYLKGEVDWVTKVPVDLISEARKRPDYQSFPILGTYYYILNLKVPPLNDVRVRQALAKAINRTELTEKVSQGGEVPAYSMVPPMTGYPGIQKFKEDVEEAKNLLAQAGFPNGKGFPALKLLYNTADNHKKIAEYIQQQWKVNLGINVELENQEWKTYLESRNRGQFQIARAGWVGDYQDPNTFLDMFITNSGGNDGNYSNRQFDELIAKAARMPPGPERFKVLEEAETKFIFEDMGVIPIYFYAVNQMIDLTKWEGWYPNVMDFHPWKGLRRK